MTDSNKYLEKIALQLSGVVHKAKNFAGNISGSRAARFKQKALNMNTRASNAKDTAFIAQSFANKSGDIFDGSDIGKRIIKLNDRQRKYEGAYGLTQAIHNKAKATAGVAAVGGAFAAGRASKKNNEAN